jgi:hypothetical protein
VQSVSQIYGARQERSLYDGHDARTGDALLVLSWLLPLKCTLEQTNESDGAKPGRDKRPGSTIIHLTASFL